MSQFKNNILDPILRNLVLRVEESVPGESAEQSLEKLVVIRNDANAELGSLSSRELNQMPLFAIGMLAAVLIIPGSMPLLGAAALVAGTALATRKLLNLLQADADRTVLVNQIEKKALDLIEASPQEAPLAPSLMKNIRALFNNSADAKQASKFTALVQRLNPPATCLKWD